MKMVNKDGVNLHILKTTREISMELSGKMRLVTYL